ncbi:DUF1294 domain-containing protein [Bacillus sp. BRMEA1]|uniref:DUF1294 domain-containing protein n=1 Tax=Neobacillus endophyticus TaxID=2738405 RepID=UPI0015634656|nr:DUF1294 domain-containing protein [Neobacillus endophyticus]NRD76067.1 DUF1294 domain-containing protein [Neobacillus endophyticus]
MKILLLTMLIMNVWGFYIMGMDKKRAQKHQYRIQEKTLWLVAVFGGAIGTFLGMRLFRHKTKHLSFIIGFPILAIVDILLLIKIIF